MGAAINLPDLKNHTFRTRYWLWQRQQFLLKLKYVQAEIAGFGAHFEIHQVLKSILLLALIHVSKLFVNIFVCANNLLDINWQLFLGGDERC